ncbi:unnamed protein product [Amoebophrya sp. A25]|nr:unnamed protein product [Amoebophrya sp. A25]|eukprot:GSA25T00018170001.1
MFTGDTAGSVEGLQESLESQNGDALNNLRDLEQLRQLASTSRGLVRLRDTAQAQRSAEKNDFKSDGSSGFEASTKSAGDETRSGTSNHDTVSGSGQLISSAESFRRIRPSTLQHVVQEAGERVFGIRSHASSLHRPKSRPSRRKKPSTSTELLGKVRSVTGKGNMVGSGGETSSSSGATTRKAREVIVSPAGSQRLDLARDFGREKSILRGGDGSSSAVNEPKNLPVTFSISQDIEKFDDCGSTSSWSSAEEEDNKYGLQADASSGIAGTSRGTTKTKKNKQKYFEFSYTSSSGCSGLDDSDGGETSDRDFGYSHQRSSRRSGDAQLTSQRSMTHVASNAFSSTSSVFSHDTMSLGASSTASGAGVGSAAGSSAHKHGRLLALPPTLRSFFRVLDLEELDSDQQKVIINARLEAADVKPFLRFLETFETKLMRDDERLLRSPTMLSMVLCYWQSGRGRGHAGAGASSGGTAGGTGGASSINPTGTEKNLASSEHVEQPAWPTNTSSQEPGVVAHNSAVDRSWSSGSRSPPRGVAVVASNSTRQRPALARQQQTTAAGGLGSASAQGSSPSAGARPPVLSSLRRDQHPPGSQLVVTSGSTTSVSPTTDGVLITEVFRVSVDVLLSRVKTKQQSDRFKLKTQQKLFQVMLQKIAYQLQIRHKREFSEQWLTLVFNTRTDSDLLSSSCQHDQEKGQQQYDDQEKGQQKGQSLLVQGQHDQEKGQEQQSLLEAQGGQYRGHFEAAGDNLNKVPTGSFGKSTSSTLGTGLDLNYVKETGSSLSKGSSFVGDRSPSTNMQMRTSGGANSQPGVEQKTTMNLWSDFVATIRMGQVALVTSRKHILQQNVTTTASELGSSTPGSVAPVSRQSTSSAFGGLGQHGTTDGGAGTGVPQRQEVFRFALFAFQRYLAASGLVEDLNNCARVIVADDWVRFLQAEESSYLKQSSPTQSFVREPLEQAHAAAAAAVQLSGGVSPTGARTSTAADPHGFDLMSQRDASTRIRSTINTKYQRASVSGLDRGPGGGNTLLEEVDGSDDGGAFPRSPVTRQRSYSSAFIAPFTSPRDQKAQGLNRVGGGLKSLAEEGVGTPALNQGGEQLGKSPSAAHGGSHSLFNASSGGGLAGQFSEEAARAVVIPDFETMMLDSWWRDLIEMLVEKWPRTYQRILTEQLSTFCARYSEVLSKSYHDQQEGGGRSAGRVDGANEQMMTRKSGVYFASALDSSRAVGTPALASHMSGAGTESFDQPIGGSRPRSSISRLSSVAGGDPDSTSRSAGSPRGKALSSPMSRTPGLILADLSQAEQDRRAAAMSVCVHLAVRHCYTPFFSALRQLPSEFVKNSNFLPGRGDVHLASFGGDVHLATFGRVKSQQDEGSTATSSSTLQLTVAAQLEQHGVFAASRELTPLHAAARTGYVYACEVLLECGADSFVQDRCGWLPLHYACLHGSVDVVRLLLDDYNSKMERLAGASRGNRFSSAPGGVVGGGASVPRTIRPPNPTIFHKDSWDAVSFAPSRQMTRSRSGAASARVSRFVSAGVESLCSGATFLGQSHNTLSEISIVGAKPSFGAAQQIVHSMPSTMRAHVLASLLFRNSAAPLHRPLALPPTDPRHPLIKLRASASEFTAAVLGGSVSEADFVIQLHQRFPELAFFQLCGERHDLSLGSNMLHGAGSSTVSGGGGGKTMGAGHQRRLPPFTTSYNSGMNLNKHKGQGQGGIGRGRVSSENKNTPGPGTSILSRAAGSSSFAEHRRMSAGGRHSAKRSMALPGANGLESIWRKATEVTVPADTYQRNKRRSVLRRILRTSQTRPARATVVGGNKAANNRGGYNYAGGRGSGSSGGGAGLGPSSLRHQQRSSRSHNISGSRQVAGPELVSLLNAHDNYLRTMGGLLSVYWLVADRYDLFVRSQKMQEEERILDRGNRNNIRASDHVAGGEGETTNGTEPERETPSASKNTSSSAASSSTSNVLSRESWESLREWIIAHADLGSPGTLDALLCLLVIRNLGRGTAAGDFRSKEKLADVFLLAAANASGLDHLLEADEHVLNADQSTGGDASPQAGTTGAATSATAAGGDAATRHYSVRPPLEKDNSISADRRFLSSEGVEQPPPGIQVHPVTHAMSMAFGDVDEGVSSPVNLDNFLTSGRPTGGDREGGWGAALRSHGVGGHEGDGDASIAVDKWRSDTENIALARVRSDIFHSAPRIHAGRMTEVLEGPVAVRSLLSAEAVGSHRLGGNKSLRAMQEIGGPLLSYESGDEDGASIPEKWSKSQDGRQHGGKSTKSRTDTIGGDQQHQYSSCDDGMTTASQSGGGSSKAGDQHNAGSSGSQQPYERSPWDGLDRRAQPSCIPALIEHCPEILPSFSRLGAEQRQLVKACIAVDFWNLKEFLSGEDTLANFLAFKETLLCEGLGLGDIGGGNHSGERNSNNIGVHSASTTGAVPSSSMPQRHGGSVMSSIFGAASTASRQSGAAFGGQRSSSPWGHAGSSASSNLDNTDPDERVIITDAQSGRAARKVLAFYLVTVFADLSGFSGPTTLEGSKSMTETVFKQFARAVQSLQPLTTSSARDTMGVFLLRSTLEARLGCVKDFAERLWNRTEKQAASSSSASVPLMQQNGDGSLIAGGNLTACLGNEQATPLFVSHTLLSAADAGGKEGGGGGKIKGSERKGAAINADDEGNPVLSNKELAENRAIARLALGVSSGAFAGGPKVLDDSNREDLNLLNEPKNNTSEDTAEKRGPNTSFHQQLETAFYHELSAEERAALSRYLTKDLESGGGGAADRSAQIKGVRLAGFLRHAAANEKSVGLARALRLLRRVYEGVESRWVYSSVQQIIVDFSDLAVRNRTCRSAFLYEQSTFFQIAKLDCGGSAGVGDHSTHGSGGQLGNGGRSFGGKSRAELLRSAAPHANVGVAVARLSPWRLYEETSTQETGRAAAAFCGFLLEAQQGVGGPQGADPNMAGQETTGQQEAEQMPDSPSGGQQEQGGARKFGYPTAGVGAPSSGYGRSLASIGPSPGQQGRRPSFFEAAASPEPPGAKGETCQPLTSEEFLECLRAAYPELSYYAHNNPSETFEVLRMCLALFYLINDDYAAFTGVGSMTDSNGGMEEGGEEQGTQQQSFISEASWSAMQQFAEPGLADAETLDALFVTLIISRLNAVKNLRTDVFARAFGRGMPVTSSNILELLTRAGHSSSTSGPGDEKTSGDAEEANQLLLLLPSFYRLDARKRDLVRMALCCRRFHFDQFVNAEAVSDCLTEVADFANDRTATSSTGVGSSGHENTMNGQDVGQERLAFFLAVLMLQQCAGAPASWNNVHRGYNTDGQKMTKNRSTRGGPHQHSSGTGSLDSRLSHFGGGSQHASCDPADVRWQKVGSISTHFQDTLNSDQLRRMSGDSGAGGLRSASSMDNNSSSMNSTRLDSKNLVVGARATIDSKGVVGHQKCGRKGEDHSSVIGSIKSSARSVNTTGFPAASFSDQVQQMSPFAIGLTEANFTIVHTALDVLSEFASGNEDADSVYYGYLSRRAAACFQEDFSVPMVRLACIAKCADDLASADALRLAVSQQMLVDPYGWERLEAALSRLVSSRRGLRRQGGGSARGHAFHSTGGFRDHGAGSYDESSTSTKGSRPSGMWFETGGGSGIMEGQQEREESSWDSRPAPMVHTRTTIGEPEDDLSMFEDHGHAGDRNFTIDDCTFVLSHAQKFFECAQRNPRVGLPAAIRMLSKVYEATASIDVNTNRNMTSSSSRAASTASGFLGGGTASSRSSGHNLFPATPGLNSPWTYVLNFLDLANFAKNYTSTVAFDLIGLDLLPIIPTTELSDAPRAYLVSARPWVPVRDKETLQKLTTQARAMTTRIVSQRLSEQEFLMEIKQKLPELNYFRGYEASTDKSGGKQFFVSQAQYDDYGGIETDFAAVDGLDRGSGGGSNKVGGGGSDGGNSSSMASNIGSAVTAAAPLSSTMIGHQPSSTNTTTTGGPSNNSNSSTTLWDISRSPKQILRHTLSAILTAFFVASDNFFQFGKLPQTVHGSKADRLAAKNDVLSVISWQEVMSWSACDVGLRNPEVLDAVLVYLAIHELGKLHYFRQDLGGASGSKENQLEPSAVLAHVMATNPAVLPSYARLPRHWRIVLHAMVRMRFRFNQFLQGECLPASFDQLRGFLQLLHSFVVHQDVGDADHGSAGSRNGRPGAGVVGAAGGTADTSTAFEGIFPCDACQFYLFTCFADLGHVMNETQYRNFRSGMRALQYFLSSPSVISSLSNPYYGMSPDHYHKNMIGAAEGLNSDLHLHGGGNKVDNLDPTFQDLGAGTEEDDEADNMFGISSQRLCKKISARGFGKKYMSERSDLTSCATPVDRCISTSTRGLESDDGVGITHMSTTMEAAVASAQAENANQMMSKLKSQQEPSASSKAGMGVGKETTSSRGQQEDRSSKKQQTTGTTGHKSSTTSYEVASSMITTYDIFLHSRSALCLAELSSATERAVIRLCCNARVFDFEGGKKVQQAFNGLFLDEQERFVKYLNADGINDRPGFLLYHLPNFFEAAAVVNPENVGFERALRLILEIYDTARADFHDSLEAIVYIHLGEIAAWAFGCPSPLAFEATQFFLEKVNDTEVVVKFDLDFTERMHELRRQKKGVPNMSIVLQDCDFSACCRETSAKEGLSSAKEGSSSPSGKKNTNSATGSPSPDKNDTKVLEKGATREVTAGTSSGLKQYLDEEFNKTSASEQQQRATVTKERKTTGEQQLARQSTVLMPVATSSSWSNAVKKVASLRTDPARREFARNFSAYVRRIQDLRGLHVTTSCYEMWKQSGFRNRAAKVIPALSYTSRYCVFFFDDNLEIPDARFAPSRDSATSVDAAGTTRTSTGHQQNRTSKSSSGGSFLPSASDQYGILNLRDLSGRFIDFSVGKNGFEWVTEADQGYNSQIVYSREYNVVLCKVCILDAMVDDQFFTKIIERFSRPLERSLIFMDVNSTIVFGDLMSGKDPDFVLLSTLFEAIVLTPKQDFVFDVEGQLFAPVESKTKEAEKENSSSSSPMKEKVDEASITKRSATGLEAGFVQNLQSSAGSAALKRGQEVSLKQFVKRFLSRDAYRAFWYPKNCRRLLEYCLVKGQVRIYGKLMSKIGDFDLMYFEYQSMLERTKGGIVRSWFELYRKYAARNLIMINTFGVDSRKVIHETVQSESDVQMFAANYDSWSDRDRRKFGEQYTVEVRKLHAAELHPDATSHHMKGIYSTLKEQQATSGTTSPGRARNAATSAAGAAEPHQERRQRNNDLLPPHTATTASGDIGMKSVTFKDQFYRKNRSPRRRESFEEIDIPPSFLTCSRVSAYRIEVRFDYRRWVTGFVHKLNVELGVPAEQANGGPASSSSAKKEDQVDSTSCKSSRDTEVYAGAPDQTEEHHQDTSAASSFFDRATLSSILKDAKEAYLSSRHTYKPKKRKSTTTSSQGARSRESRSSIGSPSVRAEDGQVSPSQRSVEVQANGIQDTPAGGAFPSSPSTSPFQTTGSTSSPGRPLVPDTTTSAEHPQQQARMANFMSQVVRAREEADLTSQIRELELRLDAARREQSSRQRENALSDEVERLRRELQTTRNYVANMSPRGHEMVELGGVSPLRGDEASAFSPRSG